MHNTYDKDATVGFPSNRPSAAEHVYGVAIDRDGRFLLALDASSLCWGFPGGRREFSESPMETLHRELREELGDQIRCLQVPDAKIKFQMDQQGEHLKKMAFVPIKIIGPMRFSDISREILVARWFDALNLPLSRLCPGVLEIVHWYADVYVK